LVVEVVDTSFTTVAGPPEAEPQALKAASSAPAARNLSALAKARGVGRRLLQPVTAGTRIMAALP
jgi:hypothetical protein